MKNKFYDIFLWSKSINLNSADFFIHYPIWLEQYPSSFAQEQWATH